MLTKTEATTQAAKTGAAKTGAAKTGAAKAEAVKGEAAGGRAALSAKPASKSRKAARDPQKTRARILKTATLEFAGKGFDGARVDRIAARCRLSKNMLYYYFGSKEDLFVAVLEGAYEQLLKRQVRGQGPLTAESSDPVEAMRQLIHRTFQALFEFPYVIRLLNEENLYKARHIRRSGRIREFYDPLLNLLHEVLRQGVEQGVFRPDLDPKMVYMSLSSLSYHYLSNRYTLELALQVPLNTEEYRQRWLSHTTDMIIDHCRAVD